MSSAEVSATSFGLEFVQVLISNYYCFTFKIKNMSHPQCIDPFDIEVSEERWGKRGGEVESYCPFLGYFFL